MSGGSAAGYVVELLGGRRPSAVVPPQGRVGWWVEPWVEERLSSTRADAASRERLGRRGAGVQGTNSAARRGVSA
jgi:hypothetical protein